MKTVDEIRKTAEGAKAIFEMFGATGKPVERALAERRAIICQPCPYNISPNWWNRVKSSIADAMRYMLSVKHDMGLSVPNEESLHVCSICGCCARLIVWSPVSVLKAHLQPTELEAYPSWCWKKTALTL